MKKFHLVELCGAYRGQIFRSEEMTQEQADESNAKMSGTVIEWVPAEFYDRRKYGIYDTRLMPKL